MNEIDDDLLMLEEFIKTFKASLDPRLWIKLIEEETAELEEALNSKSREEVLKEIADVLYVTAGLQVVMGDTLPKHLIPKEELDKIYNLIKNSFNLLEYVEEMFTPEVFDEAVRRVHKSNMSKLGYDGRPIFREDGKVLKGPNYKKPDLSDLV
jgi:predicted HAD superfamily Cof-like phosphohydrolase